MDIKDLQEKIDAAKKRGLETLSINEQKAVENQIKMDFAKAEVVLKELPQLVEQFYSQTQKHSWHIMQCDKYSSQRQGYGVVTYKLGGVCAIVERACAQLGLKTNVSDVDEGGYEDSGVVFLYLVK